MNDEEKISENIEAVLMLIGMVVGFILTLKILSCIFSPQPEIKSSYAVSQQPKTKKEVVQTVNNAIKERNQKIEEAKAMTKVGKTKLVVKAEVSEGSNVKEATLEVVVDSLTNNDIDFAHEALYGLVNKMQ